MDYPIPNHLKQLFMPVGDENSENKVNGVIRCSCGSMQFVPYTNEPGTMAAIRCSQCGKKAWLFHAGHHGWDAFVAKADYLYDLSGKPAPYTTCPHCKCSTPFAVRLCITSGGREDFIQESELTDENGKQLSEEDWVNAFTSFRMDLVCAACGQTTESVIDIETA